MLEKNTKKKCKKLDPKGHNMGSMHKNYKLHACAAHCFLLEQKMNDENQRNNFLNKRFVTKRAICFIAA
jgi:hypothetical protein